MEPLGPRGRAGPELLTNAQLAKGYECLLELNRELEKKAPQRAALNAAISKFYTLIPHSFGRSVLPALDTAEAVNKKFEMLNVLGDIVAAQSGGCANSPFLKGRATRCTRP